MFLVVIFISIKSWPQKIYVLLHSIMFTLKWLHVQKDMADLCCFLAGFCVYEACIRALACLSLCVHFWPYILAFWWRWHDNNGKSTRLTHTTDRKWKTTKLCLDGRRKVLIVASFREIGIINALLTDLNVAYIIWTFSVDDGLNHLLRSWNNLNDPFAFFSF